MFTILDYIKYYGNFSMEDVKWNVMDNLICAILVYLPIKSFDKSMSIKELNDYATNKIETTSFVAPQALDILEKMTKLKRYKNLAISNFKKIKNGDIQFGAATFRNKHKIVISFEGTDGSFIGWLENFRLCYSYPTDTQKMALEYLKKSVLPDDKDIDVVGHSKGGNLAMSSVMECDADIFKRVKKVYNFDGPRI